jgi:hypothetical protein
MKKQKAKKIKNIDELREALRGSDDFRDFAIVLGGGGMFSRKEIALSETTTGRERFHILNCIDDTMQWLSAKQLMDGKHGNIAEAMIKGAFYQLIY